jgi:hypothetical protein
MITRTSIKFPIVKLITYNSSTKEESFRTSQPNEYVIESFITESGKGKNLENSFGRKEKKINMPKKRSHHLWK